MSNSETKIVFGGVRQETLWDIWIAGTKRQLSYLEDTEKYGTLVDDSYWDSYECMWQHRAGDLRTDVNWHVPHFCSLGDWARNVTDLLTDTRYDALGFIERTDQEFLFRFYGRLLFVVSEILDDFESIICDAHLISINQQAARRKLLSNHVDVAQLLQYTNTVCKHKGRSNLHLHNHHLKYWFEDSGTKCTFANPISLSKPNLEVDSKPDGIAVPSLATIITAATEGYAVLDSLFEKEPGKFTSFCREVGDEYEDDIDT